LTDYYYYYSVYDLTIYFFHAFVTLLKTRWRIITQHLQ